MARVPPYSRTQSQVSRTGLSPAVARRSRRFRYLESVPLAWSAFARHYSRSLILMSFPPATEMFQFAGFASRTYGFSTGYPRGWVAPFGDPGINDRSHLPRAFRSVPRPSSPLSAKASTRCPYLRLSATPNGKDHDPDDRHQGSGIRTTWPALGEAALRLSRRRNSRSAGTKLSFSEDTFGTARQNPSPSRPKRSAEAMPPRSHNSLLYDVTSANA